MPEEMSRRGIQVTDSLPTIASNGGVAHDVEQAAEGSARSA